MSDLEDRDLLLKVKQLYFQQIRVNSFPLIQKGCIQNALAHTPKWESVIVDDQLSSVPGLPRVLLDLVQEPIPMRVAPQLFLVRSPECDRWGYPELKVPETRAPASPMGGDRAPGRARVGCSTQAHMLCWT